MNKDYKERYNRQIILDDITETGQIALSKAKILIVGMGGLGCPISLYLSAAGIGEITFIDDDVVSLSNLQRQILFNTNEIGKPKVEIALNKLKALNPNVKFTAIKGKLDKSNAEGIIEKYDYILDACDNFQTRYLIDDICKKKKTTYIYTSISNYKGQIAIFDYKNDFSFTNLFPKDDNLIEEKPNGVIGVLPGIMGLMAANELVKIICNYGENLLNKLLVYNSKDNEYNIFKF